MKKLLLSLFSIGISLLGNAQGFEWVKSQPINFYLNPSNVTFPMVTNGNRLIHVRTDSVIQLFGQSSYGMQEIESRDLNGNTQWSFPLTNKCSIDQIIADKNGNVFVAGSYMDTLVLNFSDTLFNSGSGFNTNTFMICISSQAQLIWKKNILRLHKKSKCYRVFYRL